MNHELKYKVSNLKLSKKEKEKEKSLGSRTKYFLSLILKAWSIKGKKIDRYGENLKLLPCELPCDQDENISY